ncbi:MAG: hypothetical protein QXL88_01985 [Candidatus Pacearchaeota archaeon]
MKKSMVVRKEDYLPQIVEYLRKNIQKGYKIDQLKWALINQGHSRVLVNKAIEIIEKEFPKVAKKEEQKVESLQTEEQPKTEIIEEKKRSFFFKLFGKK